MPIKITKEARAAGSQRAENVMRYGKDAAEGTNQALQLPKAIIQGLQSMDTVEELQAYVKGVSNALHLERLSPMEKITLQQYMSAYVEGVRKDLGLTGFLSVSA